jgi:peptidoglycan L-alanyl-D-glutamate endopeptidase CwlK
MRAYEITEVDFSVIETRRTREKQQANIDAGVSWTMDSDHLREDKDGSGVLAVDLYPWVSGATSMAPHHFQLLAKAMFHAAGELGIQIKWGGFWTGNRFDGPHFAKRRNTRRLS